MGGAGGQRNCEGDGKEGGGELAVIARGAGEGVAYLTIGPWPVANGQ